MANALGNIVPFVHVSDVPRSIAFYQQLGFELRNTHAAHPGGAPVWAWLVGGQGQLMLGQSSGPIDAGQQAVLFYLYFDDIQSVHQRLSDAGLAVGPMAYPFYCPQGEFRLHDPDDYVLMLTHT